MAISNYYPDVFCCWNLGICIFDEDFHSMLNAFAWDNREDYLKFVDFFKGDYAGLNIDELDNDFLEEIFKYDEPHFDHFAKKHFDNFVCFCADYFMADYEILENEIKKCFEELEKKVNF